MPYRDSETSRYAGPVRWRQGDVFDADDRVAVLALAGVSEISLEEAGQAFDDGPAADVTPPRKRGNGGAGKPLAEAPPDVE